MGLLPYLNPDTTAAIVLYRGVVAVVLIVAITIAMVLTAVVIIEWAPARVRRFKRWLRGAWAGFLGERREIAT